MLISIILGVFAVVLDYFLIKALCYCGVLIIGVGGALYFIGAVEINHFLGGAGIAEGWQDRRLG